MSVNVGAMMWLLAQLPALVVQWLGLILLSKTGRGTAWRCMLWGVLLTSLGFVATGYYYLNFESIMTGVAVSLWPETTGVCGILGVLLFMVGFALHAAGHLRTVERAKDLEQLCAAMAEEVNRKSTPGGPQG